jgi:type IV secretory pathway VirB10-like protein
MSPHQKNWGLGGLFLVWVTLLAVRFLDVTEPQHVALKFTSRPAGGTTATELATRPPRVADSRQTPTAPLPLAQYKNIFQPLHHLLTNEEPIEAKVAKMASHNKRTRVEDPDPVRPEEPEAQAHGQSESSFANPLPEPSFVGPPPPSEEVLSAKEAYRRREMAFEESRRREDMAEQEIKRQRELLAQQARQQKEAALQQARQLMGQYRFLGYVSQDGQQHAFLGKGHELFVVSSGETVDGRLRIKAMDANSVKLLDPGTSLETTLVLVKDGKETF